MFSHFSIFGLYVDNAPLWFPLWLLAWRSTSLFPSRTNPYRTDIILNTIQSFSFKFYKVFLSLLSTRFLFVLASFLPCDLFFVCFLLEQINFILQFDYFIFCEKFFLIWVAYASFSLLYLISFRQYHKFFMDAVLFSS